MASARAVLPMPENFLPYDYCILVLGGTGCGKSTFVNTFINVVLNRNPQNLVIAVESKIYPNVDPNFIIESEGEDVNSRLSHTKAVHYYKLSSELTHNKTILLVDTPGLGAAEGIKMDDSFIDKIIYAAQTIPKINAIVVIEKNTTNRITALVEYCLYRICEVIPNEFERKVILGMTFHTGPSDFDETWFAFDIQMKAKLNNLCFSYNKNDYDSSPKKLEKSLKEWDKSKKKITRIIEKVFQMEAQETTIYTKLFTQHNETMKAISDMTVILENIDRVVNSMSNSPTIIKSANVIKWERTLYHNTICITHNTLCHENCYLNFSGIKNTEYFKNCACMIKICECLDPISCSCKSVGKKCNICRCGSDQHVHRLEKPVNSSQALENFLSDLSISDSKNDPETLLKKLGRKKEDVLGKLVEFEKLMLEISKNYKLSRYFALALKHLELKVGSSDQEPQNIELCEQLNLYKNLPKCEEEKIRK